MRSLSLTHLATSLLLGLALAWLAPPCLAQQPKPRTASFKTKDGVELQGTFYPSPKGRDAHVVMLLHAIGGNMQQNGWDSLAQELQKEDFAVLAFDFRGHGNSKNITVGGPGKLGFWDQPINRQMAIRRFNPAQPAKFIDHADFNPGYLPMLVNDIAAAKLFLDERNDAMECNSSRLIVLGAQEGAGLGLMWMASECYRFKVLQRPPQGLLRWSDAAEADGLACAVWLSLTPTLGNRNLPTREWLELLGQKYETPMGFLYGAADTTAGNLAKQCVQVLQKGSKNPLTADREIKGTKAVGHGLLNKQLDATALTVNYLKKVREDRKSADWKTKKTGETGYIWTIRGGLPVEAKGEREEVMNLIPVSQLLK